MGEVIAIPALVIGGFGLLIWAGVKFGGAYLDGLLDAEYPTIADGDYREGVARSMYQLGLQRGAERVRIRNERRDETIRRSRGNL